MKQKFLRTLMIACLLVAAIPAVTAFTATLVDPASSATVLHDGDSISIQVSGLSGNEFFAYQATSTDIVPDGNSYTFTNMNMPFRIETAGGSATMELNTYRIISPSMVISKQGDGSVSYTGSTTFLRYNPIPKGLYDFTVSGTPSDPTVGLNLLVRGLAKPPIPNPSTLTFIIHGINSGHLRIELTGEGGPVLTETFTIEP